MCIRDRDISPTGTDLSSKITFESSDLTVLRPRSEDKTQAEKNSIVHPNLGQQLSFANKFKVAEGTEIKPGDYFILKVNPSLDLEGIVKGRTTGLDIFADGVGTIAKADYNKAAGTITYTFTDYANTYELDKFSNVITSYIQTQNVIFDNNSVPVGFSLNNTNRETNVKVVYDIDIAEHPVNYYWMNMMSKIVDYDNKTGEFVHYYYINPLGNYSAYNRFQYKPKEKVENLRIETYMLTDFSKYYNVMPPSFVVDETNEYLRKTGDVSGKDTINLGTIYGNQGYFIKVTGRSADKDLESYQAEALLYGPKADGTPAYGAVRNDEVYLQSNQAQARAKLEITAINPENEITFKKVDPDGGILTGAKFALVKDTGKGWNQIKGSEKETDGNGLVKYEKLSPGKYGLIETQAPDGFTKVDGVIEEFTVGENGVITRKVKKSIVEKENQSENLATRAINKLKAAFGAGDPTDGETPKPVQTEEVDEEVGTRPIDVFNHKEIEFEKVDATDKNTKLKGATFEVYYKKLEADEKYEPLKIKVKEGEKEVEKTMTVTSGENGKFKLNVYKPGYYALKETNAPAGYEGKGKWAKQFRITLQGKVQTLEMNPNTNLTGKIEGAKDLLSAEVYEANKETKSFKERIIINPKFQEFKFDGPDTWLRFLEDEWKISTEGKKIKVAVLENGKKVEDLKPEDYRDVLRGTQLSYDKRIVRYKLMDLYGYGNYTGPEQGKSAVTTKKALVVEIEGELDADKTAADLQSHIYFDLSKLDEIIYKLDFNDEPAYVDREEETPTKPGTTSGGTGNTGGTVTPKPGEVTYKPIQVENEPAGNVYFKKTGEDGKTPLPGAKFKIRKHIEEVEKQAKFEDITSKNYMTLIGNKAKFADLTKDGKFKSEYGEDSPWVEESDKENGYFGVEGLTDGIYEIYEIEAPNGYRIDHPSVYRFKIEKGKVYRVNLEDSTLKTIDKDPLDIGKEDNKRIIIKNKEVKIHFVKVDEEKTDKTLEGAQFELYYKEKSFKGNPSTAQEITKSYEKYTDKENPRGRVFTSGKDGKFTVDKLSKPGYYALKEIKPAPGYVVSDDFVYEFEVDKNLNILSKTLTSIKSVAGTDGRSLTTSVVLNPDKKAMTYYKSDNNDKNKSVIEFTSEDIDLSQGNVKIKVKKNDGNTEITIPTNAIKYFANNAEDKGIRIDLYELLKGDDTTGQIESSDEITIEIEAKVNSDKLGQSSAVLKQGLMLEKMEPLTGNKLYEERRVSINLQQGANPGRFEQINYVNENNPIKITNKRGELPKALGTRAWIGFTIAGLAVMIAGVFIYFKKKERLEA